MRYFYYKAKLESTHIPSILGLTTSVDVAKIRELEQNLDTACRAPLAQHQELAQYECHRNFTKIFYYQHSHDAVDLPMYLHTLGEVIRELRAKGKAEGNGIPDDISKLPMKARTIWCNLEIYHPVGCAERELKRLCSIGCPGSTSDKVEQLMAFLKERNSDAFSGIIFVRQRITAHVLSALLNTHTATRKSLRWAPCVSGLAHAESWVGDEYQGESAVSQFCSGLKNLIVATSVLEEGIDLPACHPVISLEFPDNIIYFIQRRGRARQSTSEFAMMEIRDSGSTPLDSKRWSDLEKQIQMICLDHERIHQASEVDDKQWDKIGLQLQLHTGFGSGGGRVEQGHRIWQLQHEKRNFINLG
ncbi:hypothetical protein N7466_002914 [Penicillium verhagenii]|uniref:uncharacterized protein n=1 Tax=Penicillium verhagenii TaxID=1562060 RepID=UPI002545B89B|nr:uncharacterized protein N7466_002914 [Penicillium verhagenii]KAJ5939780.1 hypothetical protein N7466_002914 [Penicillium verhagenii]